VEVTEGLKEGDKVVMLGAIMTGKPLVPPKLQIAQNMRRDAPSTRAAAATPATTTPTPAAAKPTQPGKASKP
jgi:hypothetical protein